MKITSFQYGEYNLKFCFVSRPIIRKQNVFIFPSFLKWYLHWTYNSRLTVIFSLNREVIFLHFFANHCCDWKINQYIVIFLKVIFLFHLDAFQVFSLIFCSFTMMCWVKLIYLAYLSYLSCFGYTRHPDCLCWCFSPLLKKYFLC